MREAFVAFGCALRWLVALWLYRWAAAICPTDALDRRKRDVMVDASKHMRSLGIETGL